MAKNKYQSDIAESAANMMQLPDTLEGILQDAWTRRLTLVETNSDVSAPEATLQKKYTKKQKPIKANPIGAIHLIDGDNLGLHSPSLCEQEDLLPKTVGKDGTMSLQGGEDTCYFRKYCEMISPRPCKLPR